MDEKAAKDIARAAIQAVQRCFENADNKREFEAWYEAKYGEKYVWRKAK